MSSLSFVFSCETLATSPAVSSQPVKLNVQTYLAVIQSSPPPAVGSFNLSVDRLDGAISHQCRILSRRAVILLLNLQLLQSHALL